jgi:hypothetical protein
MIMTLSQKVRLASTDAGNNMRVERRFGPRLYFHGRADVVSGRWRYGAIPEKKTLAILIIRIQLQPEAPVANRSKCTLVELSRQGTNDICLAGFPDRIESLSALLSAQRVKFCRLCMLTKIIAENRYIDIFRKSRNQTECFRQGGAALEQQPRAACGEPVKQCIQCPADPEVFLDILHRCPQSGGGTQEQIAPVDL